MAVGCRAQRVPVPIARVLEAEARARRVEMLAVEYDEVHARLAALVDVAAVCAQPGAEFSRRTLAASFAACHRVVLS